jgi:hypothetical protein
VPDPTPPRLRPRIIAALVVPFALLLAGGAAQAQLHEGDVAIADVDGVLQVGDIENGEPVAENVFAVAFGESGIPGFTTDPGYNAPAGEFTAGTRIGFNFRSGLARWDGTQFVPLPSDESAERLRITFFTAAAISGDGFVPGFDLQVQPDGGFHRHLGMTLVPPAGSTTPAPGVYLIELELYATDPGIAPSAPYWFVFDHEAEPGEIEVAAAFVRDEIAPPPGEPCPADIDASGSVDFADVLSTLSAWGPCEGACPADLDESGVIDFNDLLPILAAWGPCPA